MTAAIVSIGSVVLGEIAFDPGIHQQWRASLQQDVTGWTWLYVNASAWAPWARAFRPSPSFAHVLEPTLAVLPALVSRSRRLPGVAVTWAMIAFWLVALRDANHHNNRLATPLTQAAASPAFPCSADALV